MSKFFRRFRRPTNPARQYSKFQRRRALLEQLETRQLLAVDLLGATLPASDMVAPPAETAAATAGSDPVIWKDPVNVSISGNAITKVSGGLGWNADAVSTQTIPAGGDGYVEITAHEITTHRMFGLSDANSNSSYTSIDHALFLQTNRPANNWQSVGF